ncbi:MAG: 2'-5' RNA ligase family protein, partial [Chloroflexota bacterium]
KQALDNVLLPLGWPPEGRPFQPHLTLGRVKDVAQSARLRDVTQSARLRVEPLAVPVNEIRLYESQLRPAGPVYTIRHASHLRGSRGAEEQG